MSVAALALSALLDRGLLDYYAYNRNASLGAYRAAAALDPTSAVAYWGEALALGPNVNEPLDAADFAEAQPLIARAVAVETTAAPRDRDLIDALAARYAGIWNDHARDEAVYRQRMGLLAAKYPADDDVAMLYAEALADSGQSDDWARVGMLAAGVLARDPQHPMANHLCIHAEDDAADRASAIACARRLDAMTFAPEQEHLAHMPAHAWIETGAYAAAIASSERAYALAERLRAQPGADPSVYEGHDVAIGYAAAMVLGDEGRAMVWSDRAKALDPSRDQTSTVLVRFGRWADVLAESDERDATLAAARVLALVRTGEIELARRAFARLPSAQKASPLGIMAQARLDEHDGKTNAAARALRVLASQQFENYDAEYLPPIPAIEALGGLYLRSGAFADAIAAFREGLAHYPNDPRALYGLSVAFRKAGKAPESAETMAAFLRRWEGADTALSLDDI